MPWFDLIGGLRGILAALSGAVLMVFALCAYDRLIDDPAVARAAREAQVSKFEAESAKALNQALLIAGKAQSEAVEAAQRDQLIASRLHEIETTQMEAQIAALETNLAKTGRSCLLDKSDIDGVRNAGRQTQGSR